MKKWFVLILVLFLGVFYANNNRDLHPYHVGAVEIEYNNQSKTYQITAKFFLDDLENVINKYQKNALFFHKKEQKKLMESALGNYIKKHLIIKSNKQTIALNFIGYEEESESVYLYLESNSTATPIEVTVGVNALYDLFDDQINIVHLKVNGKRKSHKLDYPNIYFTEKF